LETQTTFVGVQGLLSSVVKMLMCADAS